MILTKENLKPTLLPELLSKTFLTIGSAHFAKLRKKVLGHWQVLDQLWKRAVSVLLKYIKKLNSS